MIMSRCSCCKNKLISTAIAVVGTDLQITIPATTVLTPDTKYCLLLAQPLPEAGENLPVTILVSGATTPSVPLLKTIGKIKGCGCECSQCTFGDQEFGIDLPECGRTRIPIFLNNDMSDFFDIRPIERLCHCREV